MSLFQPYDIEKLLYRHHAQVNIVRGPRACGKTWSVTHHIDGMEGKCAIIERSARNYNPFYWDGTSKIAGMNLYKGVNRKGMFLSIDRVVLGKNGEVAYSTYGALDFSDFSAMLFDDCNSRWARPGDFIRFMCLVGNVTRSSPDCQIFITVPIEDIGNDIACGFGITPEIAKSLSPGDSICIHNPNGLKVAYQYYA